MQFYIINFIEKTYIASFYAGHNDFKKSVTLPLA